LFKRTRKGIAGRKIEQPRNKQRVGDGKRLVVLTLEKNGAPVREKKTKLQGSAPPKIVRWDRKGGREGKKGAGECMERGTQGEGWEGLIRDVKKS